MTKLDRQQRLEVCRLTTESWHREFEQHPVSTQKMRRMRIAINLETELELRGWEIIAVGIGTKLGLWLLEKLWTGEVRMPSGGAITELDADLDTDLCLVMNELPDRDTLIVTDWPEQELNDDNARGTPSSDRFNDPPENS